MSTPINDDLGETIDHTKGLLETLDWMNKHFIVENINQGRDLGAFSKELQKAIQQQADLQNGFLKVVQIKIKRDEDE